MSDLSDVSDKSDEILHKPVPQTTVSGHATNYAANATRKIADIKDVDEQVKLTKCDTLIATGMNDYIEAAVSQMGNEHFILSCACTGIPQGRGPQQWLQRGSSSAISIRWA